ncbi:DUF4349 domain-containing protein [Kitasatospora sp. CB01950]|uniref:DUF4349 domain-containing protein n=1 Tax=Kitasatospora sp. CB01950 TaxID=1703930 RepID=UPI00093B09F0|nr:DUF4349 domain-containing protein [Kitasatospora sp. CB01950]OKJ06752.1 hypothetical protein AMK19_23055 [Kitasatospora sp. CB01950]
MRVRVRSAGAAGALAAVLLLAGCSASGGSAASVGKADNGVPAVAPADAKAAGAVGAGGAAGTGGAGAGGATAPASAGPSGQPTNRQIAYQARMTVKVGDLEPARDKAVDVALKAGGYVGSESRRGAGDGAQATLTLKVPADAYQGVLEALGGLGQRLALTSQADDLTGQIADVDSRVKSMRASVDRVRALMTDAKSLSEVVSLESELTRRESDLEALERQQQELSSRTSLSTVTLDLMTDDRRPTGAVVKHKDDGFWASVANALAGGWHALLTVLRVLLTVLAAGAPFLLVLAPLAWLLHRHRRTHPRHRPTPTGPGFPSPPQHPPTTTPED